MKHCNPFTNKRLVEDFGGTDSNAEAIEARGHRLEEIICRIWPHADTFYTAGP